MTGLLAQAAGAGDGGSPLFLWYMMGLFLLFWVVVILPMNRRQKKEQAAMLTNLKRGAKVVTSAGIYGVVVSVKDTEDEMVIKSEDTRLKVRKSTVVQVLGSDESDAAK